MRITKKYLSIYGAFIKNCLMQQMEYRTNFIMTILEECVFLLSKLLYLFVAVQVGVEANGLSVDEVTLYIGIFMILTAIYTGLFMNNFYDISTKVRKGDFDLIMTKPVSPMFYTTCRQVNLALPIPNISTGVILVVIGWRNLGIPVSVLNVATFICLILLGVLTTYSLFLLPQLLAFYVVRINEIVEITDRMWDFNSMPMAIYGKWMKRIGTFVIPVFIITNFPLLSVLGQLTRLQMIWAVLGPIALFLIVRLAWKRAIRHYGSAGG